VNKALFIPVNAYQTPIDASLYDRYPEEVVDDMVDYVQAVPYIQHLVDPDRKRAKDMDRDETGRIVVDLARPHILEDMDYFREVALHYQEHGCFTKLQLNRNPHSEYMKWYKREVDRIWNGMLRPEDGEWIPGELYFFLNYLIMQQSKVTYTATGKAIADRVDDLPESWEAIYLRFHYLHQARYGGKYNEGGGLHGAEVSSRGKSKSFSLSALAARAFVFGVKQGVTRGVKTLVVANEQDTLMKDGTLTKFLNAINFLRDHTEFPSARMKEDAGAMKWVAGYYDKERTPRGSQNEVLGSVLVGDPDKTRGMRSHLMLFDELGKAPNYSRWHSVSIPNVQEGAVAFGLSYSTGTGGTEGASFEGALDVIQSPGSNFVYGVPNYYDRGASGANMTVLFTPSYLNYKPFYNKDGVSDVVGAMLYELRERYKIKYTSPDPLKLTQRRAEYAFTLQDAIMRRDGTVFPVADLNDRINYIDTHPEVLQSMYVGRLALENGEVNFVPDATLKPVINYPHKDNKIKGCVYISEMPVKGSNGQIPSDRYIFGCLPTGEMVLTDSGIKRVEDVTFLDRLINKEGELVEIKNIMCRETSEDIYEVSMHNCFRRTSFTGEHPIFSSPTKYSYHSGPKARREGLPFKYYNLDYTFRKARDLRPGDWVKYPNIYKKDLGVPVDLWEDDDVRIDRRISNPMLDKDFWWMIGVYLGNGWTDKKTNGLHVAFNREGSIYLERFMIVCFRLFRHSPYYRTRRKRSAEALLQHQQFSVFLMKHFGSHAGGKKIPEWVKYIPTDLKRELVLGYLQTDGGICISKIREARTCSTEFVSISLELLEGMQDIITSLGLISSIKRLRKAKRSIIAGRETNQRETYTLILARNETLKLKAMLNCPSCPRLSRIDGWEMTREHFSFVFFSDDNAFINIKVADIKKKSYAGVVYNFECETHSYLSRWITTHNCDPIQVDGADTLSLFACYGLDLYTDRLVCSYVGRESMIDDSFEIARRLLLFYNGRCNYENNKNGLFKYMSQHGCLYLLTDNLEFLQDRDNPYIKIGNGKKGTPANKGTQGFARQCIREWLLKPIVNTTMDERDEEVKTSIKTLETIPFRGLLQELAMYNVDGNFDEVDALMMLMLLREDRLRLLGEGTFDKKMEDDKDYLGNDPFFVMNYDDKEDYNAKVLKMIAKAGMAKAK
jgi:hypothetical protein